MPNFNRVMLMGNLTRDPQLKYLPSAMPVAEFGMAINRRFTVNGEQREEVTFVDCAAFGKQAEVISQYCFKGSPLFIEGRLKFDQWEDKQGGGKRSRLSVVVESFQFVSPPPTNDDGGDRRQQAAPLPQQRPAAQGYGNRQQQRPPAYQAQRQMRPQPNYDDDPPIPESDIPF